MNWIFDAELFTKMFPSQDRTTCSAECKTIYFSFTAFGPTSNPPMTHVKISLAREITLPNQCLPHAQSSPPPKNVWLHAATKPKAIIGIPNLFFNGDVSPHWKNNIKIPNPKQGLSTLAVASIYYCREEGEAEAEATTNNSKTMSSGRKISLRSSDGESFEVDEAVALESQTIKHMIEDDCADNGIPLPNVTSKILAKVIEYCKKHVETPKSEDRGTNSGDDDLKNWDTEFVRVDQATLFDLILVSLFFVRSVITFCEVLSFLNWY